MIEKLQYVTRALVTELNMEQLIIKALETLNDLYQANRLSFLLLDPDGNTLAVRGVLIDGKFSCPDDVYNVEEVELTDALRSKQIERHGLMLNSPYPLPMNSQSDTRNCLAIPLVGTQNMVIGFIIVDVTGNGDIDEFKIGILYVLASLISSAMENTRLFQLATVDALTGLYVRRYFDIRLQEEIARVRRKGGSVALIMTDIDHFKKLNDEFGHLQGDVVLRELADTIRGQLRRDVDIACRYGGEEFIIILPDTDLPGAIVVAERIRKRCEDHLFTGPNSGLHINISGGVAVIDSKNLLSKDEFIKKVDSSLYEAKENGRNKIRFSI